MQLSTGLSQQQVLSLQMKQGLELLQAPVMELRSLIAAELVANPVLEEEFFLESAIPEKNETAISDEEPSWMESGVQRNSEERHRHFLESRPSQVTLEEAIQAQTAAWLEEDQAIVQSIAGNLDEWGYFRMSCAEVAASLDVSEQQVEEVLKKIQQLDPPGVAARDLKECLLIQLQQQGRGNALASRIVSHYLPQLARHQYEEIAKKLRVPLAEVRKEVDNIIALEPHPGRSYRISEEETIIPDLIVIRKSEEFLEPVFKAAAADEGQGAVGTQQLSVYEILEGVNANPTQPMAAAVDSGDSFLVRLNEEGLPRLRMSEHYKEMLASHAENKELRDYLREKIRVGKSFMHHLEQRKSTLLAVGNEIVRRQADFFKYGTYGMHPLTMAQVAEALGVHMTTISRAVAGKTIDTPRGLFSLKYFFTAGIEQEDGENVSNERIKSSLKKMIQEEQKQKPLSDQKIVARLKEQGIHVARRTIAHYREQLGILPASLRKR
jgi:RNA polymerase sigma-54 factor